MPPRPRHNPQETAAGVWGCFSSPPFLQVPPGVTIMLCCCASSSLARMPSSAVTPGHEYCSTLCGRKWIELLRCCFEGGCVDLLDDCVSGFPTPAAEILLQAEVGCAVRIFACVRTDVCAVPFLPCGVHPGSNCVPRPPVSGAAAPQELQSESRFYFPLHNTFTAL